MTETRSQYPDFLARQAKRREDKTPFRRARHKPASSAQGEPAESDADIQLREMGRRLGLLEWRLPGDFAFSPLLWRRQPGVGRDGVLDVSTIRGNVDCFVAEVVATQYAAAPADLAPGTTKHHVQLKRVGCRRDATHEYPQSLRAGIAGVDDSGGFWAMPFPFAGLDAWAGYVAVGELVVAMFNRQARQHLFVRDDADFYGEVKAVDGDEVDVYRLAWPIDGTRVGDSDGDDLVYLDVEVESVIAGGANDLAETDVVFVHRRGNQYVCRRAIPATAAAPQLQIGGYDDAGSYTFTAPAGTGPTTVFTVFLTGPGGNGAAGAVAGGGGGAGKTEIYSIPGLPAGTELAVTIPAGGSETDASISYTDPGDGVTVITLTAAAGQNGDDMEGGEYGGGGGGNGHLAVVGVDFVDETTHVGYWAGNGAASFWGAGGIGAFSSGMPGGEGDSAQSAVNNGAGGGGDIYGGPGAGSGGDGRALFMWVQ